MLNYVKLVALGLITLVAMIAANYARDLSYMVHAMLIMVIAGAMFLWVLRNTDEPVTPDSDLSASYMDGVIRYGVIATAFWGIAGFLVGTFIAFQLAFPGLNFDWSEGYANFGRLRPLHTSAVIFAFGGNALICTSFYVVQRTCAARLWGGNLAWFVFWGYQLFIVLAATGYLLGATQSKEYAEPEWYVDIWLTLVWVAYLAVFLGTIIKRKEPHIYVANWFFLAFIVTVAMLHIVNNLSLPVSIWGSQSVQVFAGVQDAMVQWWYGHNAVGFFLTAGFLGMMYYFVPKQADRPIFSYKLSIIHFWALIFLYIWAGPHHLHYTALPDWASTLGMVFSIVLWMPSWGGMINGLMTLQGAWDKLRTDPVLRMLVISLGFYGMSTFEGPMMSIRAVNSLSHYTDWTIGHVHSGALGLPQPTQTANRWILGETAKVREEVDAALENYRFNDAAGALYAFVWGKVCDWYVEFSKPLFASDDEAVIDETRATMAWVLDQCLILLHPIMPFITEELWATMAERSEMLIHADWPTYTATDLVDSASDREMSWVISLIEGTRSARAQMHVPAGLKVPMLVTDLDDAGQAAWDRNADIIMRLARIDSLQKTDAFPKGCVTIPVEGGTFGMPLEGLIDIEEEKARLEKTLGKLTKEIGGLKGRLNNPKFAESAPEEVVEEARENLAAREEEEATLKAALARLAEIG